MENPVIIFGANGLGTTVLDIFQRNKVVVYGFLDDDEKLHGTIIGEVAVLGSTDDDGFLKLIGKKCEAFIAIEDRKVRKNRVDMLIDRRHIMPVNAIADTATVSEIAALGHGNLLATKSVIQATAKIGNHNLIQTGVIVEHGASIGDFVSIGSGSVVGSNADIANDVFIGSGVIIVAGIKIGKGASIGAGSVVIDDVAANSRVFGNPAKKM
jgi:sugar O-acyltransferase (sialic acid O-acetyltransferase NeuD family)